MASLHHSVISSGEVDMKLIAEFVNDGIKTLDDLQDALQTAMQLEFSTLPPYLCAQWSIDTDPSNVAGTIQNIAIEEMMHFALAGNMLNAIGRLPPIANAGFIPSYPTHVLPGGIRLENLLDLRPLSHEQLQVFLEIEYPESGPVALAAGKPPATIGAFYDTIATGFETVKPFFNLSAAFVEVTEMASPYGPIQQPPGGRAQSITEAQAAIARIKREGEGTSGNPLQPPDDVKDGETFAHYYTFKEIDCGHKLQRGPDGKWLFDGPAITFPTKIHQFQKSNDNPALMAQFQRQLETVLKTLQGCWTQGGNLKGAETEMLQLQKLGVGLIQQGTQPEFVWPSA
jgi:hypothetical protein